MRQFIVIGLGNFGSTLAKGLTARGCQVLAIDIDKEKVQEIKDEVSEAIVMDVRDRDAVQSLPIQAEDISFVSLGDQMEISILATFYLKEMGLNRIMVKAISEDHAKILRLIGASDVIFPEQQMAMRLADQLAHPSILDLVPLAEGFSMAELKPLESYIGKTLGQLEIRKNFGLEIVLIKTVVKTKEGNEIEKIKTIPAANSVIERGDILVAIGEDKYIEKYKKQD